MNPWRDPPTLEGPNVRVRPMVGDDRGAVLAAAGDGELWNLFFTSVPGPTTIDDYMTKAAEEAAVFRSMPFVVEHGGTVVGATRFMRMNEPHRRLEIGTTFYGKAWQRTGVNTETKLLLLGHAFDTMGASCVQLRTDRLNVGSQRSIERIGAQRDGVLRAHKITAEGRIRDTVVYSVTAPEWPGVEANLRHLLR